MIKKTCPECGVEFIAENNRRKYCSRPCCHEAKRKKEKKCLLCGRDLLGLKNRSAICMACKRKEMLELVTRIKSESGCVDCGTKDHRVLDFDHVKGDKITQVSYMVHHLMSRDTILKEIEKCEVRCSNCHRIQTYIRRNNDKK